MNARPTTLLVIDDSPSVRRLVVDTLTREGYRVLQAENGEAGYALALAEHPDLTVCDIEMPVLDGWGFVAKARSTEALDTMPVLMLTTLAGRSDVRRAMATGADDYLTKPWQGSELTDAVRSLLAKTSRHRADVERSMGDLRRAILATVPHELRTPLTGILALSELLVHRRSRFSDAQLTEALGRIHRSAGQLARTIGRMMDWAELAAAGDRPADPGDPVPGRAAGAGPGTEAHALPQDGLAVGPWLADLLADAGFRQELAGMVPGATPGERGDEIGGHRLQLQLGPGRLRIDAADLRRALVEVLGNALRFSHPRLPVRLTGQAGGHDHYWLDIANMGEPIPPTFVRRLGALTQAERGRQEQQGLGLGLAIAVLALRRHGGSLSFHRHDGRPTVVRLLLPMATGPAAPPPDAAGEPGAAPGAQPADSASNRSTNRAAGSPGQATAAAASRSSKSGGSGPA